jgi:transposase
VKGLIKIMDKYSLIKLKESGLSNRKIALQLSINRKTVAKYLTSYHNEIKNLEMTKNPKDIQEKIICDPKYDSSKRTNRKYNAQMDEHLDHILENEVKKTQHLGWDKQKLTCCQIHEMIVQAGYDIGLTTITSKVNEKRRKHKECFIRQTYNYGQRLEYDFGEVKLQIEGKLGKYHMAVFSSPKSNFRWAFLYKNQKSEVFLDSHIKFFELVNGVYDEIVYDNMKNVVSKFIGRNEKKLNSELLKLSLYYGFTINTTNCYKGNEKGHVEGSVKIIRNKVFSKKYRFNTFDQASNYLQSELIALNKKSDIESEKRSLKRIKPKLSLARISECKVSKYSFITVDNNYYSAPEYLVGHKVLVKAYYDEIAVYSNNELVCRHKKIDGLKLFSVDIMHYLNTLKKKPGSLKNSKALQSSEKLKTIYNAYYKAKPIEFIEFLQKNNNRSFEQMINALRQINKSNIDKYFDNDKGDDSLLNITRKQTLRYNATLVN